MINRKLFLDINKIVSKIYIRYYDKLWFIVIYYNFCLFVDDLVEINMIIIYYCKFLIKR